MKHVSSISNSGRTIHWEVKTNSGRTIHREAKQIRMRSKRHNSGRTIHREVKQIQDTQSYNVHYKETPILSAKTICKVFTIIILINNATTGPTYYISISYNITFTKEASYLNKGFLFTKFSIFVQSQSLVETRVLLYFVISENRFLGVLNQTYAM